MRPTGVLDAPAEAVLPDRGRTSACDEADGSTDIVFQEKRIFDVQTEDI